MEATMTDQQRDHVWLRLSLVIVWLATALVSFLELDGRSVALFQGTVLEGSHIVPWLIWSGIAVDVALGAALCLFPGRRTYLAALGVMLLMTVIATVLSPGLWLDPLGSLTKNIPIAVILIILARSKA
jgi:hypothetical protein